jgi:serine/threonine-protein kinase
MGLGDILRVGNSHLRLEAAVPGEELTRGAPGPGARDDAEEAIDVAQDEAGTGEDQWHVEEVASAEDEADAPPPDASETVRLLYVWRHKLAELSGEAVGHYKLGRLLGRGRSGVVFHAEDTKTGQALALKVFSPQFPERDQELQRFAQVMKVLLKLRHPNLVALQGAGKSAAYTWVAQEYVEGVSLAWVIRQLAESRRFDAGRACRVAVHVARALDFARQHHLRHGKVTPRNILLARRGKAVKLADLMLGAALEGSQLGQAVLECRPASELGYLSPEQADPGAYVDELSDLYGLGAVVYALLTGRPPFVGDSAGEILAQVRGTSRVGRPSALNPAVPPALEKVVLKMLARRQEDRYQTPAELLADVEPIAGELGVEL